MSYRTIGLFVAAVAGGVAACSGGGGGGGDGGDDGGDGGDDGAGAAVARIEVSPGSLLFSSAEGSAALSAVAYDADGDPVDVTFAWISSNPEQIAVDPAGTVQAVSDVGSATVQAEADGVRSRPVLVASAELLPGTLLVTDAQVVSVGSYFAADGAPEGAEPQMDVRLRGVDAPVEGQVVLAAESAAVAGVVVSSSVEGDEVAVRLQSVTVPEMFARYDVDWRLALAEYELTMDDDPAPPVGAVGTGGQLRYETKIEKNFPPSGDAAFRCSAEATAYISRNLVSLKLTGDASFVYKSSKDDASLPPGYLKVAVEGPLVLEGTIGLKLEAGFDARARCELKGRIKVPIFGWFSAVVAPAIPLGVGVSLEGKLVLASLELGLLGRNGFDLGIGFECPGRDLPCKSLDKIAPINELKPKITAPSMKNMRIELAAKAYFLTGLDLVFLAGVYNIQAVEATLGPVQSAKLAFSDAQADDRAYASSYDLKLEGKVSPGESVNRAIKKLIDKDVGAIGAELSVSTPLSRSPSGTIAADRARTPPNQPVRFTFDLAADSLVYFLLGYNVESIEVYRRRDDRPEYEHMGSVAAVASNQSSFTWEWTPTSEDAGENEFFGFVKTRMPVIELELAADASRIVEVESICAPAPGASLVEALGGGGCQLNGTISEVTVANTSVGNTTTRREATVSIVEDTEASNAGFFVFRPYGTFSVTHGGELAGCPLYTVPTTISGALNGDPTQGVVNVYTGAGLEPENLYDGHLATGVFDVTEIWDCPDNPQTLDLQFDEPLFDVFPAQEFFVDEDGLRLTGSYTETSDQPGAMVTNTYSWDLQLQPAPALR